MRSRCFAKVFAGIFSLIITIPNIVHADSTQFNFSFSTNSSSTPSELRSSIRAFLKKSGVPASVKPASNKSCTSSKGGGKTTKRCNNFVINTTSEVSTKDLKIILSSFRASSQGELTTAQKQVLAATATTTRNIIITVLDSAGQPFPGVQTQLTYNYRNASGLLVAGATLSQDSWSNGTTAYKTPSSAEISSIRYSYSGSSGSFQQRFNFKAGSGVVAHTFRAPVARISGPIVCANLVDQSGAAITRSTMVLLDIYDNPDPKIYTSFSFWTGQNDGRGCTIINNRYLNKPFDLKAIFPSGSTSSIPYSLTRRLTAINILTVTKVPSTPTTAPTRAPTKAPEGAVPTKSPERPVPTSAATPIKPQPTAPSSPTKGATPVPTISRTNVPGSGGVPASLTVEARLFDGLTNKLLTESITIDLTLNGAPRSKGTSSTGLIRFVNVAAGKIGFLLPTVSAAKKECTWTANRPMSFNTTPGVALEQISFTRICR